MRRFFVLIIISSIFLSTFDRSFAQSADELRQNINSHSEKIKQLDEEIKKYQSQIDAVGTQAKTLQGAIQILDVNQKKIGTEIKKTETNIEKSNLTIQNLGKEITTIEQRIHSNSLAIAETLNAINQADSEPLIASFLNNKSLSDVIDDYQTLTEFQEQVRKKSEELETNKIEVSDKKASTENEKKKLVYLNGELKDQNQILSNTKKEKNNLLAETKNKETEYKNILATRQAEKEKFERELFDFESKLKIAIDPKSFPSAHKGIIAYPLDSIFITQYFGKTVDAQRLYVSGTHNGVDFRASRGTPVKAVLDGTVKGTGNTDEQAGCYSYGKWVLIEHENGLSSLYAHLDLIKVSAGDSVQTGDIIGYSGQTGYATGPHLHFTLLASQGVRVQRYSSSLHCQNVSIPVSDSKAYLDPMLYF